MFALARLSAGLCFQTSNGAVAYEKDLSRLAGAQTERVDVANKAANATEAKGFHRTLGFIHGHDRQSVR